MKHITKSEKETINLAKEFSTELKGGEIIGLIGDLGAGKTAFTRGIARGLGIKNKITSPTFVLMKNYLVKHDKIKMLVHIDAYRLKTIKDLEAIGALDYMKRKDVVVLIEWADKIKRINISKKIIINHDKNRRELIF